ncbi:hypothetical protein [Protaetiibacter larvae]|uniref:variant leucine-rich repeat-containing protein n=1 Tax=Protaetiibacter larvae TaxID=2592654 RepID=UPI00143DB846|nr:hypothetical protein [Protaetiibacter larvae]
MNDHDALRIELQNPTTAPARLSEIAAAAPELGAEVAAHPAVYPGLLDWLAQYGDERARAAVTAIRAGGAPAPAVAAPIVPPVAPSTPATPVAYPASLGEVPAAGASPFGVPSADAAAPGAARPKKSRVPLIVSLSVVGALVVGGGVTAAIFLPRLLPATSPEGAAQKLLSSSLSLDPLGIAGSLAPSEIASLQGAVQKLGEIQTDDTDSATARQNIERIKNAVTVTTDDLEFTSDELAEGVQRVTVNDGTLTIDGDEKELADAIIDLSRQANKEQFESYGYSEDEIDDILEQSRQSLEDSLDLPYTVDFGELDEETPGIVSVVTVQEGPGWYVSPLLTAADFAYQASWRWSDDPPALGDTIPAAVTSPDAASAAEKTVRAALDTEAGDDYWEQLAATLPLAERRVIALYGPAFLPDSPWSYWSDEGGVLSIDSAAFANADAGHTTIDDVSVSWSAPYGDSEGELHLSGTCADWTVSSTYWDYYWEEYEYSTDDGSNCLADLPIDLEELELDNPTLTAVQSDGGWQFSVLATVGEWSATAANHLVELSREGKLDSLVRATDY